MMQFRILKGKLIDILTAQAAGRYRVIKWAAQEQAAEEITGVNRTVQVYYESSEFTGHGYGPVLHDVSFRVELSVASEALVDIATINDEDATPEDKVAAINAMLASGEEVDASMDELIEIIFSVLMSAVNLDFDMGVGQVADRWIRRIQKDQPEVNGELAVITATMEFKVRVEEQILGEDVTPIEDPVMSGTIKFNQDGLNQAGTQTIAEEV